MNIMVNLSLPENPTFIGMPTQTALSDTFAMLMPILQQYVEAEKGLETIGYSMDPAYGNYNEDSERAQDRLIDILHDLCTLPVEVPEDMPLQNVALHLHALRLSEKGEARGVFRDLDEEITRTLAVPVTNLAGFHRHVLLQWALPFIAAYVALPLFDDLEEDDDEYPSDCMM